MYKLIITSFCLFISSLLFSQSEFGIEYQHGFGKGYGYNSVGGIYEGFSNTGKSSWQVGLTYNFSSSTGGKEASKESGLGLFAGYRYGFSYGTSGNLIGGIRTTFNFNKDSKGEKSSSFLPSVELGYHLTFNNFGKGGFATPSLAVGYEIPMGSESKEDYDGALFIPRIAVGYRF